MIKWPAPALPTNLAIFPRVHIGDTMRGGYKVGEGFKPWIRSPLNCSVKASDHQSFLHYRISIRACPVRSFRLGRIQWECIWEWSWCRALWQRSACALSPGSPGSWKWASLCKTSLSQRWRTYPLSRDTRAESASVSSHCDWENACLMSQVCICFFPLWPGKCLSRMVLILESLMFLGDTTDILL